jgi:hypothetical protein
MNRTYINFRASESKSDANAVVPAMLCNCDVHVRRYACACACVCMWARMHICAYVYVYVCVCVHVVQECTSCLETLSYPFIHLSVGMNLAMGSMSLTQELYQRLFPDASET